MAPKIWACISGNCFLGLWGGDSGNCFLGLWGGDGGDQYLGDYLANHPGTIEMQQFGGVMLR